MSIQKFQRVSAASVVSILVGLLSIRGAFSADDFVNLPQDLEIELALSALPADLQAEATVYVRDQRKGFVVLRQGSNDWATFVARTSVRFYDADWEYEYPADQLIPQAHDKVGQAHHVIPYFELERMRIDSVPAAEAKNILRQRFADGTYTAPTQGGTSYMFAPIHRAYMAPSQSGDIFTVSFPHHMPYAPHMSTANLGSMDPHGRSGFLDHGGHDSGPHGYLYFMVQQDQADAIRMKYSDLLKNLCAHHYNWCLPDNSQQSSED